MHPIEQLRFVARASGIDPQILAEEAADALGYFAFEPRALITACRQLLSRQPAVGPLWWLSSRLVLAENPARESKQVLSELRPDPVFDVVTGALEHNLAALVGDHGLRQRLGLASSGEPPLSLNQADIVLVPALAAGPGSEDSTDSTGWSEVVISSETRSLLDQANVADKPVWLVLQAGVCLPLLYWREVLARCSGRTEVDVVKLSNFDRLFDWRGSATPLTLQPHDRAVAPELLVRLD